MSIQAPNEVVYNDPNWEDPQGNVLTVIPVQSDLDAGRELKTVHYLGYVCVVEYNIQDEEQAEALNGSAV